MWFKKELEDEYIKMEKIARVAPETKMKDGENEKKKTDPIVERIIATDVAKFWKKKKKKRDEMRRGELRDRERQRLKV